MFVHEQLWLTYIELHGAGIAQITRSQDMPHAEC
jgi:hypothetical protein